VQGDVVSVERVIAAPLRTFSASSRTPAAIRDRRLWCGGQTQGRCAAGADARSDVRNVDESGVPYTMSNTVIEFEPDRRIAWKTVLSGFLGRFVGGRIWRYEFEPVDGGTWSARVGTSQRTSSQPFSEGAAPIDHRRRHDKTLESLARIAEALQPDNNRPMIDTAWEKRVLPALAEYTRIECLSPAFDPDWGSGGHSLRRLSSCAPGRRSRTAG